MRSKSEYAVAKSDPTDPTWQYVALALIRARTYSRTQGHQPHGDSCCFVGSLALGLIMQTRNSVGSWKNGDGGPTLATDDPKCVELAYADHYLNMRASTAFFGKPGYVSDAVATATYDTAKKAIFSMKEMGNVPFPNLNPDPLNPMSMIPDSIRLMMMARAVFGSLVSGAGNMLALRLQENPNAPLSVPTAESLYWGNEGNTDGLRDAQGSSMYTEWQALNRYRNRT